MITPLYDVTDVEILGHYRLRLTFSDGLFVCVTRAAYSPPARPRCLRRYDRILRPGRLPGPTARTPRPKRSTSGHQRTRSMPYADSFPGDQRRQRTGDLAALIAE